MKKSKSVQLLGWSHAMLFAIAAASGYAQQSAGDYPRKPVRVIVGNAPGAAADILVRNVGQKLTERWGQQIIIDNREGASGIIAMEMAARATPDGYTLYVGGNSMILAGAQNKLPFDVRAVYAPVVRMTNQPYLMVIYPGLPVHTVKEFIALAKAKPGTINYASSGNGSATHLGTEMFKSMAGVDLVHVPYKGIAQSLLDVIANQVQLQFSSTISGTPYVRSGKLRAIAVTTLTRVKAFPDLPTVSEAGVAGFELANSFGIYAPAHTPAAILVSVNKEVAVIMNSPQIKDRLSVDGTEAAAPAAPAEFAAAFTGQVDKWQQFFKTSGLKLD